LETEPVSLRERVPDVPRGPQLTVHRSHPRPEGPRRSFGLRRSVVALVDFHDRLESWVIVAPVGALVCGGCVTCSDPVVLPQIRIEDGPGVHEALILLPANGQRAHSSFREHDITVTVRVRDAPLIPEERDEVARQMVEIVGLLPAP